MVKKIDYRLAKSDADAKVIADFQLAMAWETEKLKLDPNTVIKGVSHIIANPVVGHYWMMWVDGQAIAATMLLKEWSDWRARDVWWIHSLYLLPEYRGSGIYSDFYKMLQGLAQSDPNCGGIRLYVDRTNIKAQKIYQHLGMTDQHYALYEWLK
jgi:ribosomal protein S18 acetylase RimI-like enzyme